MSPNPWGSNCRRWKYRETQSHILPKSCLGTGKNKRRKVVTLGKILVLDPAPPWIHRALITAGCLWQHWLSDCHPCCGPSLHQITVQRIISFDLQEVKEEISMRSADQTRHIINFSPAYSHWTPLPSLLSLLGQIVIFATFQSKAWGVIVQYLDHTVEKCPTICYCYTLFPVSFEWTVQDK